MTIIRRLMMKIFSQMLIFAAVLGLALTPAAAQHKSHTMEKMGAMSKDMSVTGVWARPPLTPTGAAAVYMTVVNKGQVGDRLVGVKTNEAKRAEIHTHLMADGIARMRRVDDIPVTAGGTITMKPGGFHVMLMRPSGSVKEGAEIPLTLVFEKAGEVDVMVKVRNATATDAGGHMHGHGNHGAGN